MANLFGHVIRRLDKYRILKKKMVHRKYVMVYIDRPGYKVWSSFGELMYERKTVVSNRNGSVGIRSFGILELSNVRDKDKFYKFINRSFR